MSNQPPTEFPEDQPKPQQRRYRIILLTIVTFALIAFLVSLGTVKPLVPAPERTSDTLVLYALSSINFIASLVLLAVLTRNLLKLRRERAERKLGSKFKTKMVIFSIGISLLPGILLFFFAYGLLNTSLDIWFSSPARNFFTSAENMRNVFLQRELDDLTQITRTLMRATSLRGRTPDLIIDDEERKLLEREYVNQQLRFLEATSSTGLLFTQGAANVTHLPQLDEARSEIAQGHTFARYVIGGDDQHTIYLIVGVPITRNTKPVGGVFSVRQWPQNLADSFLEVAQQGKDRDELSRQAKRIKVTNLYLLGAMTLLLIFAATWIALYVARGITVPIQALAEATEAVARGNFDIRVLCPAEDELATLVQSFNQMASQLSENRHNLDVAAIEQRETNRALDERRHYIETILQSLSTGVISLDNEHNLITINQAALTILRCDNMPTSRTPAVQLFAAEDQAIIQRMIKRARRSGQLAREVELHSQSTPLHTAVTVTPLRDNRGIYTGSVVMIEDISDLINAQRSAVWSEVARRMAHEIKNPLTPIQLSAERIAKNSQRISSLLEPKFINVVEECTTTIKQEVGTLQRMVDEFSRFARLPQAQLNPESLNDLVTEALKLYQDRLEDIAISTNLAEHIPSLNLDKDQIKRTLVNLIDNAVEAMASTPGKHQLTIQTELVSEREIARLIISDTGHGIVPEDREKLFQPYFSTRKRGTGLGLAIVSHIITDHQGKIRVEANQPRGTRFIIELPVAMTRAEMEVC